MRKLITILAMAILLIGCVSTSIIAKDKIPMADKNQGRITVLKNTISFADEKLRVLAEQYKNFNNVKAQAQRELNLLEVKKEKKK